MNTYQAGALTATIRKEFSAREEWMRKNMELLERTGQLDKFQQMFQKEGDPIDLKHHDNDEDTNPYQRPASRGSRPASAAPRMMDVRPASVSKSQPHLNGSFHGSFVPDSYDPEVYEKAVRIGSPHMQEQEDSDIPRTVQRRVTRQVEMPYTRQVKVPVKTRRIVPTRVQKKVLTKKLVEVPSFKMIDETYTELRDEPAVRTLLILRTQLILLTLLSMLMARTLLTLLTLFILPTRSDRRRFGSRRWYRSST
jgi:hypothetical protein